MTHTPNVEQRARRLVRELESVLCQHLGIVHLDPDFLAELYMSVLDKLRSQQHGGNRQAEEDLASSLALTVYLVTASQQPGGRASTELIPRLHDVIARSLLDRESEASGNETPRRNKEDGR